MQLKDGEDLGTLLNPPGSRLAARKQWLASQLQVKGRLFLDRGAAQVLTRDGRSLLPVGVKDTEGDFKRGELVTCMNPEGGEVARGLVNYSAGETHQIMGHSSGEIETLLGYVNEPELIHRDNMVIL